jgi:two-component system response regulator
MDTPRAATILLVEDNPDHAELTLRALRGGHMLNEIHWVKDGQEALDYLTGQAAWAPPRRAPRPDLVLLDVQLPRLSGHEVLERIKSDPALRTIPVVMLTTSGAEDDVGRSYRSGANSFVTKPVSFTDFVERVRAVKLYWVLTNVAPAV